MDYAEGPRPKRFASIVRSHWCGNERRNRDRSGKSFEEVDRATVATRSNRAVGILIANYSGVAGATSRVAVSRSSRVAGARGLKGESNRRLANWNGWMQRAILSFKKNRPNHRRLLLRDEVSQRRRLFPRFGQSYGSRKRVVLRGLIY
jgi:hypothetical protein